MRLSLVLWCQRQLRGDQRQRTLSMGVAAGLIALVSPAVAVAQSPATLPKIGLLVWDAVYCEMPDLIAGLRDLGRIPGENIIIECRSAGGRYDGLARAATELVRLPVDVIVSTFQPAAYAARDATATIPIVSIVSGDPVGAGLAHSLSAPGGNLTGLTYYATELAGKRLELLREMVPTVASVGVLADPPDAYHAYPFEDDAKRAAKALGMALVVRYISSDGDLDLAFHQMKAEGAQAVFVLPSMVLAHRPKRIADLALAEKLPLMAWGGWFTEVGGLMDYSADYGSLVRRLAVYVDKILKGAQPGNLPIEQAARFELSINLRTARTLGLTIPPELFVRADKVIE